MPPNICLNVPCHFFLLCFAISTLDSSFSTLFSRNFYISSYLFSSQCCKPKRMIPFCYSYLVSLLLKLPCLLLIIVSSHISALFNICGTKQIKPTLQKCKSNAYVNSNYVVKNGSVALFDHSRKGLLVLVCNLSSMQPVCRYNKNVSEDERKINKSVAICFCVRRKFTHKYSHKRDSAC